MNFTVGIVSRNLASTSNFEIVIICTFLEASRFGCRKTKCEVTKVIYNMYSCYICCMSREMMRTDGRDSAKCRKFKAWGHSWHYWIWLNDNKTKYSIVPSPTYEKEKENVKEGGEM